MKRFHFRLNSVLLLRKRRLNEAEEAYSRASGQRRRVEETYREGQTQVDAMNAAILQSWEGKPEIAGQQESLMSGIKWARVRLQEWEKKLEQAREFERKQREQYIAASRDYELLEKLKTKKYDEHLYAEMQKEQSLMDDMFNARRSAYHSIQT